MHRRRRRRRAGHDEEPAHRAGRGAREVRRRAGAGGGRAGADGRQHRQRAGRGGHRAQDGVRADQQVRLAGRAAGGGRRGERPGQARRRDPGSARRRCACRASWCACATTCRCRSRCEELHRIDPDKKRLRGLFTELEFSRLADQLSASGAAAIAPHAENTPAPVPTARCPRRSRRSRRRRRVPPITKRAELEALAADIRGRGRGRVCRAVRWASAVRSDLVGIGVRVAERRAYLPLGPPLPGRAQPACRRPRRWRCWRRCWRRPRSPSTSTTRRRWRCCCSAAASTLAGVASDSMLRGVPAGCVAHALRPGRHHGGRGRSRRSPAAPAGWAAAPRRSRGSTSRSRRSARGWRRRRPRRWRWRAPPAGGWRRPASSRCTATWSCRSRTCWRTSSAAASSWTPTGCARSAWRSARSWPRWRRRSTRWRARRSTSTRPSSWPTSCSASWGCR